jgi:hypothetical protein
MRVSGTSRGGAMKDDRRRTTGSRQWIVAVIVLA